jgi:ketosteroid isomerase-like protein
MVCNVLGSLFLALLSSSTASSFQPLSKPSVVMRTKHQNGAATSCFVRDTTLLYASARNNEKDDQVVLLPLLEAQLAAATNDPQRQEELQTQISDAKTAAEFGVRRAQVLFYDAFSSADFEAMSNLWSKEYPVRCVHPGMASLDGRDDVMESWKQIFNAGSSGEDSSPFTIRPANAKLDICGTTAICSCIEQTPGGGKLEALNIYKREDGIWKMTLHMACPVVDRDGMF